MQQLFNVSERFSKSLDLIRGPNRKKNRIQQLRAWIRPSSARRAASKGLTFGGVGILVGAISLILFRRRKQIIEAGSNIKSTIQDRLAS